MAKIDVPKKKTKIIVNSGKFRGTPQTGDAATLSRDDKGEIVARRGKNYAGMSDNMAREAQSQKRAAKEGDSHFDGASAPRVGGGEKLHKGVTPTGSGTKKMMIKSIKRAKKSDASPQAKKAALRILRG
jgi:hypothetical protein